VTESQAKFWPGQLIHHRLFDYRGVVIDVDPQFQESDEWYEEVAQSRPPKDQPWYHVLVHEAEDMTYVAERNIEADETGRPVVHRLVPLIFSAFENGSYVIRRKTN